MALLSSSATSYGILRFINCANQDANNHEIRNGVSPDICPMNPNILKKLNLSARELEVFVTNTQEWVAKAEPTLIG
jgi:hypothetical protein